MKKSIKRFLCIFLVLALALALTPGAGAATPTDYWTDEGNYDLSWYDASKTEYHLTTAAQLAGLARRVNESNESRYDFHGKTIYLDASVDLSAHLWTPIGVNSSLSFIGTFDGQGNAISGLTINNGGNYAGLFGGGLTESHIKNIYLVGCSVSGVENVGGVVGYTQGKVSGCTVTGSVTGTGGYVGGVSGNSWGDVTGCVNAAAVTGGGYNVGGVVGYLTFSSTISDCLNTGAVSGVSGRVGGVAGYIRSGHISGCGNTGSVTASATGDSAGGVVGEISKSVGSASVTSCYNTGSVSSARFGVGGVVGQADSGVPLSLCWNSGSVAGGSSVGGVGGAVTSTVTSSYNTGAVSSTIDYTNAHTAGIAGYSGGGVVSCYSLGTVKAAGTTDVGLLTGQAAASKTNSYAAVYTDTNITGVTVYNGSGVSSDVTANFKTLASYGLGSGIFCDAPTVYVSGGTFSAANPVNQGFPVLKAFGYTGATTTAVADQFTTDSDGSRLVRNAYQLDLLRGLIAGTARFALKTDGDGLWYGGVDVSSVRWIPGSINSGMEFDGGGLWVSGLGVQSTDTSAGLFFYVGGKVKNLTVTGSVRGDKNTGGIVGHLVGTVKNCVNLCTVSSSNNICGGIAGLVTATADINSCVNLGSVAGGGRYVGGIAGELLCSAKDCLNAAPVSGTDNIGGIAGSCEGGGISAGVNLGAVTGTSMQDTARVGGIVGGCLGGSIELCKNSGAVKGESGGHVGGVAGAIENKNDSSRNKNSSVYLCENTGSVSGRGWTGGIVGYLNSQDGYVSTVSVCRSLGTVTVSDNQAGGIVGYCGAETGGSSLIKTCFSAAAVVGSENIGGVAGQVGPQADVSDCVSVGSVTGASLTGGVAGNIVGSGTLENCYYANAAIGVGGGSDTGTASALCSSPVVFKAGQTASVGLAPGAAAVLKYFGVSLSPSVYLSTASAPIACGGQAANSLIGSNGGKRDVPIDASKTNYLKLTQRALTQTGFDGGNISSGVDIGAGFVTAYVWEYLGGVLTSGAPDGASVIAAAYNGEQMKIVRVLPETDGVFTLRLPDGNYKFFWLQDLVPINACAAS